MKRNKFSRVSLQHNQVELVLEHISHKPQTLPKPGDSILGVRTDSPTLPSNLPSIPPPTRDLMSGSVYSMERTMTKNKLRRKRTLQVIKGNLLCRICAIHVPAHLFSSHSELCTVKTQWEVRSLECDNYLRKLHAVFVQLRETFSRMISVEKRHLDVVILLLQMTSEAVDSSKCNRDVIQSMLDRIGPFVEDTGLEPLHSHLRELSDWLSYKLLVEEHIEASRTFLNTLLGGNANQISAVKIPSLKDFQILKYLARGGFALVFLAKKHEDYYAIKVLDRRSISAKTQMENVFAERNIMATISCPFVVPMFYAFATSVSSSEQSSLVDN